VTYGAELYQFMFIGGCKRCSCDDPGPWYLDHDASCRDQDGATERD